MLDNCWTPYVKIHIVKAGESVRMTGFGGSATWRKTGKKGSGSKDNPLTVTWSRRHVTIKPGKNPELEGAM